MDLEEFLLWRGLYQVEAEEKAKAPQWGNQEELAAMAIESSAMWSRLLLRAWGAKDRNLPRPPDISHPDRGRGAQVKEKPKLTTDPREVRRWFQKHARR